MALNNNNSNITSPSNNDGSSVGHGGGGGQFGDTTLTKVFVGGLAWETPKEVMRQHFEIYGDILEAVIISDKITGRSKGYGFVTFKEAEAANKAVEDATPIINGRRANCNLAALGARRPKQLSNNTSPAVLRQQQGGNNVGFVMKLPPNSPAAPGGVNAAAGQHVQWYYPPGTSPAATPFHPHHQLPAALLPFYGYTSPAYIATAAATLSNNNHKLSYNGGGSYSYMNGQYYSTPPHHQMYVAGAAGGQGMLGAAANMMPMYPYYPNYHHQHPHHHHQSAMGIPAHMFPTNTTLCPISTASPATISSKPLTIAPPTPVCLTVE